MIDLKGNPFFLSEKQIGWVSKQIEKLTMEQKAGQLFLVMGGDYSQEQLCRMVDEKGVGGILYRPATADEIKSNYKMLDTYAAIPLLKAANLEEGGSGGITEGTLFGWPMSIGATDNVSMAERLALVCAEEGKRVGINLTFSPVSDRSLNPLNPITNIRAFGSDTQKIMQYTEAYVKTIQQYGIAACTKHFPGDGIDFRDQHLHPTYNTLPEEEWYESYGKIYRNLIDRGLLSIMAGHIVQPEVTKKKNPSLEYGDCLPASMCQELLTGVLRQEFGFEGVIMTDATIMGGFTMNMPRAEALVMAINAGADMLVFNTDFEEEPAIFISLSNPYHLMDIPRIPIYINTYSATRAYLIEALKK